MPIRINLLAEAVAADELRRRDPVKRAIYLGAFFVALSLVWFSSTWLEYMVDKQNLNRIDAEIQTHTNDYARVKSNLQKISDIQRRMDSLDQLTAARFLQGNLLNALQKTSVPNVQLTRMRVEQSYTATAAILAKTNGTVVVAGRPPIVTEHIMLTMDAKDFSPANDQINRFKDALLKHEYFTNHLNAASIRLSGLPQLQTPLDSKPFVMSTLECRFLDKP